jgi:hypothetical protein
MVLFALPLAGCATCLAIFSTLRGMEEGLPALVGKTEAEAFAVLGEPTLRKRYADKTLDTWSTTLKTPEHQVSTGPELTDYYTEPAREDSCEIRLVANPEGRVIHSEYEGSDLGCLFYSEALYKYLRSRSRAASRSRRH